MVYMYAITRSKLSAITYLQEVEVEGVGHQVGVVEGVGLVDHQEQEAEEGEVELHPLEWEVGVEGEGEQGLTGSGELTPVQWSWPSTLQLQVHQNNQHAYM